MKCHEKLSWGLSLGNMSPANYQIIRRGLPLYSSPEAILAILVNFILDRFVPAPPFTFGYWQEGLRDRRNLHSPCTHLFACRSRFGRWLVSFSQQIVPARRTHYIRLLGSSYSRQDNLDEYVSSFVVLCPIRPRNAVTTAVILDILLFERYHLCPPEQKSEDD